jgi:hypothetical protein
LKSGHRVRVEACYPSPHCSRQDPIGDGEKWQSASEDGTSYPRSASLPLPGHSPLARSNRSKCGASACLLAQGQSRVNAFGQALQSLGWADERNVRIDIRWGAAKLHDRMPVILADSDWSKWLGEEAATDDELLGLLKPCPDEALKIWPVGKAVGNVKNTGPQLAMPLAV